MSVCTFFGHRQCPEEIKATIKNVVENLIVHQGVDTFYVGNQGQFDAYVRKILRELTPKYPQCRYCVVLAYLPVKKTEYDDFFDTMLPEGIESVHPRFAISWRNDWLLRQSDFVIVYIKHTWGGAYKYAQKARKQEKTVIDLV